jgi:copper chaperone CopZ
MKVFFSFLLCLFLGTQLNAQITKVSLQASGLTCSMCSKAVKSALEEVGFVEKVQVDIKNQQYNLTFKEGSAINLDALSKAVEDAGFSVAALKVTAAVAGVAVAKDEHVKIGDHYFHFLNAKTGQLNGNATFSIVDKSFVSDKEAKKWSSTSKMQCVQTGRAAACCTSDGVAEQARVYHAIM